MDEDLYDEFGNYIGGDVEDSDDDEQQNLGGAYLQDEGNGMDVDDEHEEEGENEHANDQIPSTTSVVLHEDKKYYPSANDVYGDDVEVVVQERDSQSIAQPIVQPDTVKTFTFEETGLPNVNYSREFQTSLMQYPDQMRNVAIVGHLNHGKTSFLDMLVAQTHDVREFQGKLQNEQMRYTDIHVLEREKGITIFNSPISLVLPNRKSKSHLFNLIDTPGHVDFVDEIVAAGKLVDGFVVVVDVVEGLSINTQQAVRHAVSQDISIVLVVNKVDRLIMELNMPPNDAYSKLVHCIEQVNDFIREIDPNRKAQKLTPELGNVIFASAKMEWCFSLESFADIYASRSNGLNANEFAKRLWGDIYYNKETRKFTKTRQGNVTVRSFVHFVMNPLYKLYSHTISEDAESLDATLRNLGINLRKTVFKMDIKPLLKLVCKEFFGPATAFVDCVTKYIPSPVENASSKIRNNYSGSISSGGSDDDGDSSEHARLVQAMNKCDPEGPLAVHITKLYNSSDATEFYALGRVMSGTLCRGASVKLLGESFSVDDHEDSYDEQIDNLWIPMTRYKIPIDKIPAGCWALIKGIDSRIAKTATILGSDADLDDSYIFSPLKPIVQPVFQVAIEPLNPSELPRMLDGLRKVTKCYVLLKNIVEDSGEHTIFGSGELYMDCVMHDLRLLFADIEIKVSDPSTKFSETCIETTALQCPTQTPNKKNTITILSEPLDDGISTDIENGKVDIHWSLKKVGAFFQKQYNWDILEARNIWAFGPGDDGPNVLVNDTLPEEIDRKLLNAVRDHMRHGFNWACKEGPLCAEPLRNTKFRVLNADISDKPIMRPGGQIIAGTRWACFSSFMLAAPRLMEPVYSCHITCNDKAVDDIYSLLQRRRGNIFYDNPISGTPLSYVQGQIPVIDSFGFETDVRLATQGESAVSLVFDRWQQVPGDPLDRDQKTKPLQTARSLALARDFVLKTRRRKGMSEEPSITSYVGKEMLEQLKTFGALA